MYIKKIIWAIALLGLLVAGYLAYYVYNAMFVPNTTFNNTEAYVYVPTNGSYSDVREQLQPLLKNINSFDALANRKQYITNIKAGRFVIKKGMNNNDIINTIRSKNVPLKMAFNNQQSIEDLAGRVSTQIEADSLTLIKVMLDPEFLKANDFSNATALGMYIPNSYEFFWNTSAKQFRDRMLTEYNRFWTESRLEKAKALNLTKNDVMTLASIVYEESKQGKEQPRVAGVYINRMRIKMPLQADPTLKFAAYQLPEYKNTIIKRVLNKHKDIVSPYNTYMYTGLPPGLVTMPDISAIDAVLNYEKHSYLYFAADAKRLGYHKFAKTLSQHNANAREYHAYLSKQGIYK
ncbi:endolytic transglycosylase MltG [Bizionia argentinensis JUB59]|uniref:Endolytic murein transglycosylase n=1 Tax=Bizionia argentinensis JUB59 TaxID=1046627 RepID=G2EGM3_9FLAO|nr:endolytic transglycosylase MltG [Bizionia argentinensis]EGV42417.1 endolytic transglycosylase MltG [Bizionia argentinensis JUB59]